MKLTYLTLALAGAVLAPVACDDGILDIPNQQTPTGDTYFASAAQFDEAVLAQYSTLLLPGMYSRDYYFTFDLLANDAQPAPPLLGDLGAVARYQHGPENPLMNQLWVALYRMALRSNYALDVLGRWDPTTDGDRALKAQYTAESRFFRGFAFGQLAALWGDVPYRADFASHNDFSLGRTPVAEVWTNVEADMEAAIAGLPESYTGAGAGRATTHAARALLGRFHLWQGDFAAARATLEPLAPGADHPFALNPDFDNQFSELNKQTVETVFDVNHVWTDWGQGNKYYMFNGQEAWGGVTGHTGRNQEYGFNDWNNVSVSLALARAFTYDLDGQSYVDPRAALTFYGDAASGGDTDFCAVNRSGNDVPEDKCTEVQAYDFAANGYKWRKYNRYEYTAKEGEPDSEINTQIVRYADVLLMLAEARIETGDVAGGMTLINRVRERVDATAYAGVSDAATARTLLRRERRLELAGEQSRWFDLVRWGTAVEVLNAEEALEPGTSTAPFEPKMVLLPIPQVEVDGNAAIVVNGGWN